MLSEYQLKIADLYIISTGNTKKLVPISFDKQSKFTTLLENRIKTKKIHRILEYHQSQYIEFNTQKRIEAEKTETKMEKRCTN